MGAQVGTAFVRVRPEMSGFKSEVQTGVRGAFSGIGKVTAGLFVAGGIIESLKAITEAAAADQSAFAVLEKAVENAGASNTIYGHTIEDLLSKQARLRGFTDEELASSFTRIVSATHDSAKAFRDLGLAEDVSRARHIGVAQAAIAISKAEQGVTTALQRLGIVVRPTTANVDALKKAHDDATAAGVKFTKQQDAQYKAMLVQAKAQDAVASRAQTIATLQQRFGGVATSFANTASGAWARLHEQVHQFEEFLGEQVLPGLTRAGITVGEFFQGLSTSSRLKEGIGQTLSIIGDTARAVGPPLLAVGQAIGTVTSALGVPTILAAAVAYKSIGVATDVWTGATKRWAATQTAAKAAQTGTAAGAAATVTAEEAASAALTANTESLLANTAALRGNAFAAEGRALVVRGTVTTTFAATAANEAFTATEVERAAATTAATAATAGSVGVMATLRTGLLGLVGGPVGALTIGLAAAAAGMAYLLTRESALDAANRRTADSFNALASAQDRVRNTRAEIGDQRTTISTDRTSVQQARLAVLQAQQTLATTTAKRGSLEYEQAALGVVSALQQQQAAVRTLADDQRHLGAIQQQSRNEADINRQKLEDATTSLQKLADGYRVAASLNAARTPGDRAAALQGADSAKAVSSFVGALNKQATALQAQHPLLARNTSLLAEFAQEVGRIPTRHETKIILSNKQAKAALDDLVGNLIPSALSEADQVAKIHGASAGASWVNGFGGAVKGVVQTPFLDTLLQGLGGDTKSTKVADAAKASAATVQNAAKVAAEAAANAASALKDARANLADVTQSSKDALQSAADGVLSAQEALAQAITSGGQQITDAVQSAKQNLFSIGDRLASDIDTYLGNRKTGGSILGGAAAKEFKRLSALIKNGGGTPEIQREAAALSSSLQAQSARAALQKTAKHTTQQQIEDLVDSFARGPQNPASIRKLNQGIAKILRTDKLTFKAVAKEMGTAFAHDLFDQIDAIRAQAGASAAGPRRRGSGREPTIVRPEQTVIQVQRQIADAQRTLLRSQLAEAKTQTEELKKIAKATQTVATKLAAADFAKTQAGKKAKQAAALTQKVGR